VFQFKYNEWSTFPEKLTGSYVAEKKLKASHEWQTVSVGLDELLPMAEKKSKATQSPTTWQYVTEFGFGPSGTAVKDGKELKLGGKPWQGPRESRKLRWDISQK